MFRVTMQFSGKPVRKFTFDKSMVTIGRDPTCDIVIENIGASRRHAMIEQTEEGYVLADLKSHNGTFVAGEKVFHHRLSEAEEFFIGKFAFVFEQLDPVVECDDGVPEPGNGPEPVADMTFRLDRREIEKILHHSARGTATQLVQLAPDREKRTLRLDKSYYVIGKDLASEVRIGGLFMPAKSAVLVRTEQGWRLLGMARGVKVNGDPAADSALNDGDLIQIKGARFRFCQA